MRAVSPREDNQQEDKEREKGIMTIEEEMFGKVFGQSAKETLRETSGEGVAARARKVESVPSRREVEEHNLDHAVFRSWCLHCVKGRTEAYGHQKRLEQEERYRQ